MSRTRKTDPTWVKERRSGLMDHDHRHGHCLPEPSTRPTPTWHSTVRCPQHTVVAAPCPGPGTCNTLAVRVLLGEPGANTATTCGQPHRVHHRDTSIPCTVCDTPAPTCHWTLPDSYSHGYVSAGNGVPAWYLRHLTHAPNRTEERRALTRARKTFNAGTPLDDFDEADWEPRRIRDDNAGWYWW